MILNQVRCDYLTVTTYDKHDELLASFADLYPISIAKEAKVAGYKGHQWDGLFFGTGKQRNRAHFIARASGEGAQTILSRTRDIELNCTRLDLQITIWIPDKYDPRRLYDTLASVDTLWPGRRLVPQLIQSGDGLDTVYIGDRTSDRFCRIYVKPDVKGNPAYLRFEMEYKGAMARAVRKELIFLYAYPKSILRAELDRLPYRTSRALRAFEAVLGDDRHKVRPEAVMGRNKTLDWLEGQIEPTIIRLLHSHEDSDRMKAILDRWSKYAENLG